MPGSEAHDDTLRSKVQAGRAAAEEPLRGVAADGVERDVLSWPLTRDRCAEITAAGLELMECLSPEHVDG